MRARLAAVGVASFILFMWLAMACSEQFGIGTMKRCLDAGYTGIQYAGGETYCTNLFTAVNIKTVP